MTMNACITSLVLALASPALAFQPSTVANHPSTALQNALRDMASYPEGQRTMSQFEDFDRNGGAYSRSPQGGMGGRNEMMGGRPDMMDGMYGGGQNPNPFSRRGNPNDRMYTQDGFDPYSAYGASYGRSQSDRRGGPGPRGMEYYGEPGMMGGMMGGGMNGGGMNGVHDDNTLGGFSYSSRVREQGRGREYGGGQAYDYEGMGGGFDGPMMGGGMEYEQYEQQGGYPGSNGGYGGFEGGMDMGRMGP